MIPSPVHSCDTRWLGPLLADCCPTITLAFVDDVVVIGAPQLGTARCHGVARRCCDSVHSITQDPRTMCYLHRQLSTAAAAVTHKAQKAPCKGSTPLRISATRTLSIRPLFTCHGGWGLAAFNRQAQPLQALPTRSRGIGIEKPRGSGVSSFGTVFGGRLFTCSAPARECRASVPKICLSSARCTCTALARLIPSRCLSARCQP